MINIVNIWKTLPSYHRTDMDNFSHIGLIRTYGLALFTLELQNIRTFIILVTLIILMITMRKIHT